MCFERSFVASGIGAARYPSACSVCNKKSATIEMPPLQKCELVKGWERGVCVFWLEEIVSLFSSSRCLRSPAAIFWKGRDRSGLAAWSKETGRGATTWAAGISAPQAGIMQLTASFQRSCHPARLPNRFGEASFLFFFGCLSSHILPTILCSREELGCVFFPQLAWQIFNHPGSKLGISGAAS